MEEFISDEKYRELIPDGKYEAQCVHCDGKFCLGKARKLFLIFKIIESGDYFGKQVFMAFNMPYSGKVSAGSKYFKNWVMVNGWQKPSRNATMSPRLFLNKIYIVKTRTVKPLHNGKEMPEAFCYAVVDEIIEVCA